MACRGNTIIVPPSRKHKLFGNLFFIYGILPNFIGDCNRLPHFWFDSQKFQYTRIHHHLIGALFWHLSMCRRAKVMFHCLRIHVTDFHLSLSKCTPCSHAKKQPRIRFFDQWIFLQLFHLLFRQVLKISMIIPAGNKKIRLLQRIINGNCDCKQCGKHHGCKYNSKHCDHISCLKCPKASHCDFADACPVCYLHHCTSPTFL